MRQPTKTKTKAIALLLLTVTWKPLYVCLIEEKSFFLRPIFSVFDNTSDGDVNENGEGTLCEAWNWVSPWTYLHIKLSIEINTCIYNYIYTYNDILKVLWPSQFKQ